MLLIKIDKVKKYYGDKLILDIDNLEILENDRVGIVGENGAGKTTLIKTIIGEIEPDEGKVSLSKSYSYISQSESYEVNCTEGKLKKILGVPNECSDFLSGGEKVKIKINEALTSNSSILIADEPTANLDTDSIKIIEKAISRYKGTLLLVSHDRDFLDKLCTSIIEIDNGKVKLYKGNYSKYSELKTQEKEVMQKEYDSYIDERSRLETAILGKENSRNSIRRTPKRMGNSEARLHKMGGQKAKKNLDGNIKALKSRINHLEVKEKPKSSKDIKIRVNKGNEMISRTVIDVQGLNLTINNKSLVNNGRFKIRNGKKVAIIGKNGCGKTTLMRELLKEHIEEIKLSKYISIGYLDQEQEILDGEKTIIDNIKSTSFYDESFIRTNLDGFGFKGDTIYKNVSVLSGGEKVKVALCKIILSDNNTLFLDEPTNYLDIKSIEALENALINTEKTVLLISHDRHFISNVCNYIIEIQDSKLRVFNGTYSEFINERISEKNKKQETNNERENKEKLLILENKLSELISRLSVEKDLGVKEKLSREYEEVLKIVKLLKA